MNQITIFVIACVLWAVVHSITAASWFKARIEAWLGPKTYRGFYRIGYTIFSVLTFIPLFGLYIFLPNQPVWSVEAPFSWLLVAVQLAGLGMAGVTLLQSGGMAFVGLEQVVDYLNGKADRPGRGLGDTLVIQGLYRWMRHPLYTFSMLFLWASPVMSRNQLIFNLFVTAYFVIGSIFEERRMIELFGDEYVTYQKSVKRFIRPSGNQFIFGSFVGAEHAQPN